MSATRSLRIGIVGAGLMGHWHANAVKRAGGRLTAVTDLDLAVAERLAASYSGAHAYSSVERMLRESQLDALHLCTPPVTHRRIAELAIDAGLHLLIEKPVTQRAIETERLFHLAARRNVAVCPVHQFLFQDGTLKAAESLPRIGRVIHIHGTFCSAGGSGQSGDQLDGIAADILPHPLSLMQKFLPGGVAEAGWETSRPGRGEFRAVGESSGVSLTIFISMNSRPTVCSLQIFGAEGTIHLNLFHGYAVIEPGEVSRTRKIVHPFDLAVRTLAGAAVNLSRRVISWQPAYPGLQRLVGEFYKSVQNGTEPPISPADTLVVSRIRDSLTQHSEPAGSARQFSKL